MLKEQISCKVLKIREVMKCYKLDKLWSLKDWRGCEVLKLAKKNCKVLQNEEVMKRSKLDKLWSFKD